MHIACVTVVWADVLLGALVFILYFITHLM